MNSQFDYTPPTDQPTFEAAPFGSTPPQPAGHSKGYSIAALVLGIVALFCTCCCCCFYFVAPICSVIAIVMAIISRRNNHGKLSGMALTGLLLAILALLFFLVILVFDIVFFTMPAEEFEELFYEFIYDSELPYEELETYISDLS